MLILGLLLTTQFRIQRQAAPDPSRMRADELVVALKEKDEDLQAANARIADLQQQVEKLKQSASQGPGPSQAQSNEMEMLAGTLGVTGPGVVVTMSETTEAVTAKNKVADEDIWRVLNELFTSGAEAVSVNGVRIGPVTGIRNVGNRILINQTMVAAPIEIQAVGDPAILEQALKLRGGVIELLGRWGIQVKVTKSESLKIPALRSTPAFRFGKPGEK